jgi:hypothetical protein
MNQKYEILSGSSLIKMAFEVKCESNADPISIIADIDILASRVYFSSKIDGIDYKELQNTIISYVKPSAYELPDDIRNSLSNRFFEGKK